MSHAEPFAFVQRTFTPVVGSLTSPSVEQICQKNHLSFSELVRPFCTLNLDQRLRDPSGNDHLIKNLYLCIQDVNEKPPQLSLARKLLNESVSKSMCDSIKTVNAGNYTLDVPTDCTWFRAWCDTFLQVQCPSDHEMTKHLLGCLLVTSTIDPPETIQLLLQTLQQIQTTSSTPASLPKWFSSTTFKYYVLLHDAKDGDKSKALNFFNSLKTAYGADHCFFLEINSQFEHESNTQSHDYWVHHVAKRGEEFDGSDQGSSPRTPADLSGIGGLPSSMTSEMELSVKRGGGSPEIAQEAGEGPIPIPVVLHPLSPDLESSQLNTTNDYRLPNNKNKVVNTNVWHSCNSNVQFGACLSTSDVENIKNLIRHVTVQVLIPHVEKLIFQLNDIASNKKGVSRSLLSATKRLFGTSKPGTQGVTPVNSVIYAYDAPELQLRRLGDLYFMFTNYSAAYQAYHSAKREFGSDQAWLYYAGALEMTALSAFMQGETSKKAVDYMEEAIVTYFNSCKMTHFATRATLLSSSFLKDHQMYGEAAKQLIRMTSEDSDLRSALLLEQASYCFLYSVKPKMSRKYAFHMVLSGHRFSKAGQKRHALRCYKQAFQVYQNKGWSLAQDHIHFTIGRLAGNLKLLEEGSSALACLISSGSKQTSGQQVMHLREYLIMHQQYYTEDPKKNTGTLPLPIIEDNSIRVLISGTPLDFSKAFEPDSPADSVRWSRMEELAVVESLGHQMIFRPTIHLFSKETVNNNHPVIVVNEPVYVQVFLKNPLQVTLPLLRVRLLWEFCSADGKIIQNEEPTTVSESIINTNVLETVYLEPNCTQNIVLCFIPQCAGDVKILGIYYLLTCPSPSSQLDMQQVASPSVPGKLLFQVRGPKLKPKKEDPNAVCYEDDKRLLIKVVHSAPLLELKTEELKSELLCGEVELMNVKLFNNGNAPLKRLYMVTSAAPLISLSDSLILNEKTVNDTFTETDLEYHDMFMNKDGIYRVMEIALGADKVLIPGQELILPIWVRAPDRKGRNHIKILFYYESTQRSPPRYRVTRCHREISVHESVQLTAVASRSTLCKDKETMNIVVTAKNVNQTHDSLATTISLIQFSLVSPHWVLQDKSVSSKDLVLHSQENCYFLLKANRTPDTSIQISDASLSNEKSVVPGSKQPFYDFYKWHVYTEKDSDAQSLFHLVICLRWKADVVDCDGQTKTALGQSHISLRQLQVMNVWPPDPKGFLLPLEHVESLKIFGPERKRHAGPNLVQTVQLENALTFSLLHACSVFHSFQESRICKVDMKLVLRNCIDYSLQVIVNAPGSNPTRPPVSKTQLYTPHSSTNFTWISRASTLVQLKGHECFTVQLCAAFTAPGTYDLGSKLAVAVSNQGNEYISQLFRVESAIIILGKEEVDS